MTAITGQEIGPKLLAALGLSDMKQVRKIVITIEAPAPVIVHITRLTDKIEGDALVEEFNAYELKAKE